MHFTDAQIMAQIRAALEDKPEEKILAILCNWCSYAGADLAGTSRFAYEPYVSCAAAELTKNSSLKLSGLVQAW
jgi:hypothetical protein